tara:strand:- start:910 stop:1080 length:171 start_codon:yes stop_codon:yes gene_type:complete
MSKRLTRLCDGDCGNVYYVKDLFSNCYGSYMCNDCMFHFIAEQEDGKVCDAITGEV